MRMDAVWSQVIGKRQSQQDSIIVNRWENGFHLLLLSDGMGGHVGGKEASELIVKTAQEYFSSHAADGAAIKQQLLEATYAANTAIKEYTQKHTDLRGMGGTFVATAFDGEELHWASVGDSPMWLIRDGCIQRLNENHSMMAVLIKELAEGELTEEQVRTHPHRTQLLEAVMGEELELIDTKGEFLLEVDDIIIIASDGVETCSPEEIMAAFLEDSDLELENISSKILQAVESKDRPGQDNISLIICRITLDDEAPSQAEVLTVDS